MALVPEPIIYKPEWSEEKYIDVCPFEPNKPGTRHFCTCRNQKDTFKNMTEFKMHTKNQYHKIWVKSYGIYSNKEIEKLTEEIKQIKKENAKLNALLETHIARAERYKIKYEKIKNSDRFLDCE